MSPVACYEFYSNGEDLGECPYCREDLSNGKLLMAHLGEGYKHPIHKECLVQIIKYCNSSCPNCRVPLQISSIISISERCLDAIRPFTTKKVIYTSLLSGAVCHLILSLDSTGLPGNPEPDFFNPAKILLTTVYLMAIGGVMETLERHGHI